MPRRGGDEASPAKLAKYRAKRDFEKTAEPSGETAVTPSPQRRFVIQKHAARRLHYDLRLELDGVFKSWAVTRGPSLDPHDRRLAVEVEDHPLDYGDFEGTIPQGEYGGGTVQLWDRGYWQPDGSRTPEQALAGGELKFTLAGQRLRGGWVLVRLKHDRDRGKRTNWLLIKHRDEYAHDGDGDDLLAKDRSVASGRTMAAIAAGKGRGPAPFMLAAPAAAEPDAVWHSNRGDGVEDRAASPARPLPRPRPAPARKPKSTAAFPDFIPPQLCRLVGRPPSGAPWVHEIKFDGYRMQLRVEAGEVALKTRKGLDWTAKFAAIAKAAASLGDCIVDGEIVAHDHNGTPNFAALQAALSEEKTDDLVFYAFDLLFEGDVDLRPLPLSERKARLQRLLSGPGGGNAVIRYVEHFESGGDAVLKSACRLALEGIVSKRLEAPYQSGRTDSWVKAKCRAGHEVVIGGWTTTNGKFRSLLGRRPSRPRFRLSRPGRHRLRRTQAAPADAAASIGRNRQICRSPASARRVPRPISTGPGRSWSPRSNSPAGPAPAWCARRRSKGCARTSPPPRSRPSGRRPPKHSAIPAPAPRARPEGRDRGLARRRRVAGGDGCGDLAPR